MSQTLFPSENHQWINHHTPNENHTEFNEARPAAAAAMCCGVNSETGSSFANLSSYSSAAHSSYPTSGAHFPGHTFVQYSHGNSEAHLSDPHSHFQHANQFGHSRAAAALHLSAPNFQMYGPEGDLVTVNHDYPMPFSSGFSNGADIALPVTQPMDSQSFLGGQLQYNNSQQRLIRAIGNHGDRVQAKFNQGMDFCTYVHTLESEK